MDVIIRTSNLVNVAAMYHHPATRPQHSGGAMMFGILSRKVSGIYVIVNTHNGKRYVGSAVDMKKRWHDHQSYLRMGKHHNRHLQNAWNKYGAACFRFSVVEKCEISLLLEREQFYMDTTRPEYNVLPKAGSALGRKHSEETRRKISESNKGKVMSDEARRKISDAQKGKVISDETRHKLSIAGKGRTLSEETKLKLSKALRGKTSWLKGKKRGSFSEEWRHNLSEAHKGQTPWHKGKTGMYSEEVLRKMSESHKGKASWNKGIPHSKETRNKISEANRGKASWNKGRVASEDERQKNSESHKGQIPWNKGKRKKGKGIVQLLLSFMEDKK